MNITMKTCTSDLSWVTIVGGPKLTIENSRDVKGLPEKGWWVWPDAKHIDQSAGLGLNLHTPWDEPETGTGGKLLVSLQPVAEGVAWNARFMVQLGKDDHRFPACSAGVVSDFQSAREAALAWRPMVRVIDGVELWTDPANGSGQALELHSGELTWKPGAAKGSLILWRFEPAGLGQVAQAMGSWSESISGACDSLDQMLVEVDEARERIRSEMRKFLLNF